MKIIEDYLDILCSNYDSQEVQELKEEIKEHLSTTVQEFICQGYDLNEAQNKAIEQFGSSDHTLTELRSIYRSKIDIRKELLKKLRSIRWKLINIFGWLLGATFFTAHMTVDTLIPIWLTVLLCTFGSLLIVLSIIIFVFEKIIDTV